MDVGVTDETLNGINYEESSSSEDEAEGEDGTVVKSSKLPERPVSFNKMEDVKRSWESSGAAKTREEMRAEQKKEISQIRSRLFQGKQCKMKEMYEQAVADSEGKTSSKKDQDIVQSEKARLLKERFERGEVVHSESEEDEEKKAKGKEDDMSVFEAGISKKSRSIFLELDASAAKTQTSPLTPPVHAFTPRTTERRASNTVSRQVSEDIIRASDPTDDVVVATADVSDKFKFFETYKAPEKERKTFRITPPREGQVKVKPAPLHRCVLCLANMSYASDLSTDSPDREIYRDPEVVRSEDTAEDETIVKRSQTASRMLSLFRQMEEQKEELPDGPKPLKCFTPPPDYKEEQSGSSEEEDEESEEEEESEDDTGIVRASDKIEDEFLKSAQNAAKAKALKEKFEHWEPEKQSVNNAINLLDSEQESIESTKSLRARFESLKAEQPKEKPRPKVNRFVLQEQPAVTNKCVVCDKTVYPLEKVEVDGKMYHGNCFRCQQCQCKLRMDSYTQNNDHLYCLPHFRQLFIAKGNYDEGFGSDQHKRKWESSASPVNGH
uniref:LIM zinc-binding domain-containing protein n=3 Tax=Graphocephala atropunctata TaxID=36148 RepID=A0A1B6LDQ3_9HEMI